MKPLASYVTAGTRFSRSANVERDHGGSAIDGYLPTGRAVDVISRVAAGLTDPSAGRTFSITGPHGGGKSSLIVFLDSLLSKSSMPEFKTAHSVLGSIDSTVDARLRAGLKTVGAGRKGFIRAFATAANEPVATTISRALHAGAVREIGPGQDLVPEFDPTAAPPEPSEVKAVVQRVAQEHPLLLVIDEFGKNLEYFATSGSKGDPFLLQELAELTQGENALPLVVITLQHLSFDEYVQGSSTARRREWAKVQGRFQDIPYIETAAQSRRLIGSALEQHSDLRAVGTDWVSAIRPVLEEQGLRDIADDAAAALPLHPLALAVLPDLCSRYGQNERTLFSFLTGAEPAALPRFLQETSWAPGQPIPLAGLDVLYDYFLESSSSMIGVADGASRWIEIETRIRDTVGLSAPQLKALKTIGVVNLVSSGGRIRASKALLKLALTDTSDIDVDPVLESLIEKGLITFRAFSDEYRIWQGSDYNLRRVVDNARSELVSADLLELLKGSFSLDPLVAGRHSQTTGVLRVFGRQFATSGLAEGDELDPAWDGAVRYLTDEVADTVSFEGAADGRPVVYVIPQDISIVRDAAIDTAALSSALRSAESEEADWVARRELSERLASSQQHLHNVVSAAWDSKAAWILAGDDEIDLDPTQGLSALLSVVADAAYPQTPLIANEMIARRDLTSQGAKARRFLIDAMLSNGAIEAFGIDGYGPDRAIYEAVFRKTGMHRQNTAGEWALDHPTDSSWKPVWKEMNSAFDEASGDRVNLADIAEKLCLPPIGVKGGIIPLLLVAALVRRSDEVALYEHGSLVLEIDDAVAERLTKNLGHFTVKNTMTKRGKRAEVISSLVVRLGIPTPVGRDTPTFLNVATTLFRTLRVLPPYSQRTRQTLTPEAIAVRDAFHQAAEPDVLVFETLPKIFGFAAFTGRGRAAADAADRYAEALASALRELRNQYPNLLEMIQDHLAVATAASGDLNDLRRALEADATRLSGHVLEPRLKAFVGALARPLDDQAWLENVAMVVSEGQAPRVWTDDVAGRFPLKIAELGGALRRTSALLHERLADRVAEGYSTSRMTLTRPDGSESIELLSLTTTERKSIDEPFERVLEELTKAGLSRTTACRMLMARLALEHEEGDPSIVLRDSAKEDQRYA
jgi:hypothetical protein